MRKIDTKVIDFLGKHRVGSLAIALEDGTPHVSAMHYSYNDNPIEIYFMTENTSKKCKPVIGGETAKASFVTGFSEEEWITLQMDGEIRTVKDKKELVKIHDIHFRKHPEPKRINRSLRSV